MSKYQFIKFEVRDKEIGIISVNRPKKMNAVSFECLSEIEQCILNEVQPYSSGLRVLILAAEGKHFTSGIDMQSAAQISQVGQDIDQGEPDVARIAVKISDLVLRLQRYTSSLEVCRVPVICAIQGYCIGAGIDMSSACDIRLCSKDAKFTIKEVDIGICADLGTIQRF
jgi:enoyl-CoA hydratase